MITRGRNLHAEDYNVFAPRPSILAAEAMSWVLDISQLQFNMAELNIFQEVADRTLSHSCPDAGVTVMSSLGSRCRPRTKVKVI